MLTGHLKLSRVAPGRVPGWQGASFGLKGDRRRTDHIDAGRMVIVLAVCAVIDSACRSLADPVLAAPPPPGPSASRGGKLILLRAKVAMLTPTMAWVSSSQAPLWWKAVPEPPALPRRRVPASRLRPRPEACRSAGPRRGYGPSRSSGNRRHCAGRPAERIASRPASTAGGRSPQSLPVCLTQPSQFASANGPGARARAVFSPKVCTTNRRR
ncbi:MAG: hypothetical protein CHACPFDD_03106 [Phycisphaerae bacterium]|nr:hypothetical protein [Phycisphaerae bacterium]